MITRNFNNHFSMVFWKTMYTKRLDELTLNFICVCVCVCAGSNWASRQGFTDLTREFLKSRHVSPGGKASTKDVRLSAAEEAVAGIIGLSPSRTSLSSSLSISFHPPSPSLYLPPHPCLSPSIPLCLSTAPFLSPTSTLLMFNVKIFIVSFICMA